MRTLLVPALAMSLLAAHAQAQTCDEVNPSIQSAVLQAQVVTLGTGYRYTYSVVNPATDTGCVRLMDLDLSTRVVVPDDQVIAGPGIPANHKYPGLGGTFTPPGVYSATVLPQCRGSVGGSGGFGYSCVNVPGTPVGSTLPVTPGPRIYPGQSLTVGTIVSPWPPGPRNYLLEPWWSFDDPHTTLVPADSASGTDLFANVQLRGSTVGPVAPSELVFYDIDSNGFLRYTNPVQHETDLRASETQFPMGIAYGPTINPTTFRAVLNKTDISSSFHPAPNRIEGVSIPLSPGSNTLVISVEGTLSSGRVTKATDRLVFGLGK